MAYQGYEGYGSPNLSARERAVLALLNRQRAAPKNIGEGINAIGESIGDRMIMDRMAREEAEGKARSQKAFEEYGRDIAPAAPVAAAAPTFTPPTQGASAPAPIEEGGYNILEAEADQREARRNAIAGGETGGRADPYGTRHAVTPSGDRAYGRYGIMGQNIPQWSQAALGQQMTPQQFLRDKAAQNVVFDEKFGDYVKKYGEEGAARAWFAGERGMRNPNATDMHGRVNVAQYGQNYLNRLDPRAQIAETMMSARARGAPDPALAAAMAATESAPGVPPVNPTMPGGQPPVATPPAPLTTPAAGPGGPPPPNPQMAQASQAALPVNQGIGLAPPPRALQPPPVATQPQPGRPPEARMQPPTREEIAAQRYMSHPDAALAARANADFTRLYNERKAQFASDLVESRAAQQRWDDRQANAPKLTAEAQKSQLDLAKGQREAREAEQFQGIPATIVHKDMNDSAVKARAAAGAIRASQVAMAAFNSPEGVFSGAGADWKLKAAKAATAAGVADYSKQIKNTEVFQGSMQPIVASILHETSGSSGLTENELAFARAAAAGDINLDGESVRELMRIIQKRSEFQVGQHQTKMDELFPDNPKAKAMYGVEMPKVTEKESPPAATAGRRDIDEGKTATGPGGKRLIRRNGRWEPM